ncbi:MAG: response regulator transcription factor [Deltaproteobacteria bacterium]|nr:response regulator transcription factor [Deltaproteobacteria bacterium]
MSRKQIRVLLVEDHTIVRQGLRALIEGSGEAEVVGEAADGRAGIDLAERLRPDVVIMDLSMPGLNGVDATERIVRSGSSRVLALSMHTGEEYVRPAVRAGVSGYLVKGSDLSDLLAAIKAVAAGEAFFSPAVARIVLDCARPAVGEQPALTGREREILQLVAEGRTSKEIAGLLHISAKTVEGHRGKIMQKLGIHELAGLVRYAVRIGLVSSEP